MISYQTAHDAVRRAYGKASEYECQMCERTATAWAYDHLDPNVIVGETRPGHPIGGNHPNVIAKWSEDPRHYMALCGSCHRKLDNEINRTRQSHHARRIAARIDLTKLPDQETVTIKHIAAVFNCGQDWIRQWIKLGKLTPVNPVRKFQNTPYKFRREDVLNLAIKAQARA